MIKGKAPRATQPKEGAADPDKGGVKLQKRTPPSLEPQAVREKTCSRCGSLFRVDADKKFFLCPDCYRKGVAYKRHGGAETRVMILVNCSSCGKAEYLSFVPDDREKALCRDCFSKVRPEPNPRADHSRRG